MNSRDAKVGKKLGRANGGRCALQEILPQRCCSRYEENEKKGEYIVLDLYVLFRFENAHLRWA